MIDKVRGFVSGLSNNLQGAFWLFMSVFAFTTMAALAKYLGNDFHAFQISFFRASFSLIVILPFLINTETFSSTPVLSRIVTLRISIDSALHKKETSRVKIKHRSLMAFCLRVILFLD